MWKELTGEVLPNGDHSINFVDPSPDRKVLVGKRIFLRDVRRGFRRTRDLEASSYLEIADDDIVLPTIAWGHGMDIFVGFIPTLSGVTEWNRQRVASTEELYSLSVPKKIIQQDIWTSKNGKIRGVAWVTHKGKRQKPIMLNPGRSYYLNGESEEEERLRQQHQKEMAARYEDDMKRFARRAGRKGWR